MFGGDGNSRFGGGGAALGGAIFNDSGSVVIRNSTFFGNTITRGNGGGTGSAGAADNGADAGGAIFSVNGHLTVIDATFSGNLSTGSDAAITVVQLSAAAATSFLLDNTIIYGNGATDASGNPVGTQKECSIVGPNVTVNGAGNLIENNDNCPGLVSIGNPLLGPLQLSRGFTPTMAIGPTSAAFNMADASTSLAADQRGIPRPSDGGFDIGAFEYCDFARDLNCNIVGVAITVPLTILVSPTGAGTTTPGPGTDLEIENTVTAVTATAAPGYKFSMWLGSVASANSAATTVVMNVAQTITAVFVPCGCAADVSAIVTVTRSGYVLNPVTGRYAQTVMVTNNSASTITGPLSLVLDGLSANATLFNATGTTDTLELPAGSPYLNANVNLKCGAEHFVRTAVCGPDPCGDYLQHTRPSRAWVAIEIRGKSEHGKERNMQKRILRRSARWYVAAWVCALLVLAAFAQPSRGNVIYVTTLNDTIGDPSGCSLKDAIYSSRLRNSVAIKSYTISSDQTALLPVYVSTFCVAGSGNDMIILPNNAILNLSTITDDADNFVGSTATPMINSTITIEAYGATLRWTAGGHSRAFLVAYGGNLTIHNALISGFSAKGGNGSNGGGGGLGAGGAIYVADGSALTIENCTFESNVATGGNGGDNSGSSGQIEAAAVVDGMGGNGGGSGDVFEGLQFGGGGGGGSRGNGGNAGGVGGGTVILKDMNHTSYLNCGAIPTVAGLFTDNGTDGACPGGGGSGGGSGDTALRADNGGNGNLRRWWRRGRRNGEEVETAVSGAAAGAQTISPPLNILDSPHGGNGGFGAGGGSGHAGGGAGGLYGGLGSNDFGGGGGALGGAIFVTGGTLLVQNSTFFNNSVDRGNAGGAPADNGADAGGAIFSFNGQVTIQNSTISGNQSTGSAAGVEAVVTDATLDTVFILDNTIIFNNGTTDGDGNPVGTAAECSGYGKTLSGAGNLIQNNLGCPGVESTGDPLLGPLLFNRGFTPTMAIGPSSAAFNMADAGTSLSADQRGIPRPSDGGFDIGAFEYCDFAREINCNIVGVEQTEPLTIMVSPPAGGTTTPGPGSNLEIQNTVTAVTAIATPGYQFSTWLGSVAAPPAR